MKDLPGVSVTIDDGLKLVALGRYPITDWLTVIAKLGAYWWDAEGGFFGVFLGDDNSFGASFTYGTGMQIGTKLGLRFEWDRFDDVSGSDIDFYSSSLVFNF